MDHQIETSVFWVMNQAFYKNLNWFYVTQLPVSGSSLEEPYILIHDVFMIYDVLSNTSVWVLYQLKGIYCILQLKNFYFLKEHIIFI